MDPYYQQASVFLSTSVFEGFPCTAVESREFGVPGVYYDLPFVELLKDQKGCICVPQQDAEGAAEAVARLLVDGALRKKMGLEARESIEQFAAFDYESAWKKILQQSVPVEEEKPDQRIMGEMLLRHMKQGLAPNKNRIAADEMKKQKEAEQRTKDAQKEQERLKERAKEILQEKKNLEQEKAVLEKEKAAVEAEKKKYQKESAENRKKWQWWERRAKELEASRSYKIGRVILWLPGKAKKFLKTLLHRES